MMGGGTSEAQGMAETCRHRVGGRGRHDPQLTVVSPGSAYWRNSTSPFATSPYHPIPPRLCPVRSTALAGVAVSARSHCRPAVRLASVRLHPLRPKHTPPACPAALFGAQSVVAPTPT